MFPALNCFYASFLTSTTVQLNGGTAVTENSSFILIVAGEGGGVETA